MEDVTSYSMGNMNTPKHMAYVLLGSNINPEQNIPKAVSLLEGQVSILQASSIWESASADCCYPDYLNLAVLVSTPLYVNQLKEQVLRPVEAEMGRVRTEDKNASRTIDIDIIIFDGVLIDQELWRYVHLAVPVGELLPDFTSGEGETLQQAARRLAQSNPIQLRDDISIKLHVSNRQE